MQLTSLQRPGKGRVQYLMRLTILIVALLSGSSLFAQSYSARTDLNAQPYPNAVPCPGVSCSGGGSLTGANTIIPSSDFGNQIVRLTDVNTAGGSGQGNVNNFGIDGSGEVNFMNKNDDRLFLSTGGSAFLPFIWNGSTLQATQMYASSFPSSNGMVIGTGTAFPFWSYTQPYIAYSIEWSTGTRNASIYSYDFTSTTTAPTRQLVVDLTTCVPAMAALGIPTGTNFTVSADDQTFGVTLGTNSNAGNIYVVIWNRTNGCRVWNTSTGQVSGSYGGSQTGSVNISDKFWLHNARLSKDGNWMRVDIGQCTAGSCSSPSADITGNEYLWQVATLAVNVIRFSSTSAPGGHQAMGYTHMVNQDVITNADPNTEMVIRPFTNVASPSKLLNPASSVTCTGSPCANHSSWVNDLSGDTSPVFSTTCVGTFAPREAWDNEIIAYATDGSGKVYRFSHTYGSCKSQYFESLTTIGSVSQSGNWFAWSSDWNGMLGNTDHVSSACVIGSTCRSDVFITSLTQAAGSSMSRPEPPPTVRVTGVK